MIILTLRTDKPEAEIGLFDGKTKLAYETWQAHRELAETIHKKIASLLGAAGKNLQDLEGIVAYEGPGSFTGLRIGLTVANTLAYAQNIPVVASGTADWTQLGIARLLSGENDKISLPEYGAEAHITQQKK
jgi:tRNA threonylcarbamoyladenosine biosynthesis protein TsaB